MDPEEIAQALGHHQPDKNEKTQTILNRPTVIKQQRRFVDAQERIQFLREMEKAREELAEFKKNINLLMQELNNMSLELETSKERVSVIEQDLTVTEEENVNLQVLLKRATKEQKDTDVYSTHIFRNMYTELASVVHENNQLQGRISLLESHQKEQRCNVHGISKRMQEYTEMLEQAQSTIHMLQEPKSRRTSLSLFEDDDDSITTKKESEATVRSSYIQSPPLGPQQPKQGLGTLFYNQGSLNKNN